MHGFIENATGKEHLALVYGDLARNEAPLIRLHSECLTSDALLSTRCDCGFQINRTLQNIVEEGCGVLLYLCQEVGELASSIRFVRITYKMKAQTLSKPMSAWALLLICVITRFVKGYWDILESIKYV